MSSQSKSNAPAVSPQVLPTEGEARRATVEYATRETRTNLVVSLDGTGQVRVSTGVGYFDHMLEQFTFHGLLDLELTCEGDLHVDCHHTVEDVAIALGRGLDQALGARSGIRRYGHSYVPMDETLARTVLDFSGRPEYHFQGEFLRERIGTLETQMIPHFFKSVAVAARLTVHQTLLYGDNDHHKSEALFKSFGRAISEAVTVDPRRGGVSSTKGVL